MSKNLVLSAAIGYKFSQIEFFIKSLRKFYKDKVVLLISGGGIKLEEELKKFNCETIKIDINKKEIQFKRYEVFLNYLQNKEFGNILLCDSRDIYFQANPFEFNYNGKINFFLEDQLIKNCHYNSNWILKTYGKEEFHLDKSGRCTRVRVAENRFNREQPYEYTGFIDEDDEYWLRVLMKLRFAETEFPHTPHDFEHYANLATQKMRLFGVEHALRYINGLTKGFFVTKFIKKGGYWHGQTDKEYDKRVQRAQERAADPVGSQYELTGTKNRVR